MVCRSLFGFSISFFGVAVLCLCLWFFCQIYSSFLSSNRCYTHTFIQLLLVLLLLVGALGRLVASVYYLYRYYSLLFCICSTVFHKLCFLASISQLNLCVCVYILLLHLICFCIIFQIHPFRAIAYSVHKILPNTQYQIK